MHQIALYYCIASFALDFIFVMNLIQFVFALFFGFQILSMIVVMCGCVGFILNKYLYDLLEYHSELIKLLVEDLEE